MKKFFKELTDFSDLNEVEFSPSDDRSFRDETLRIVFFIVVIVLLFALYSVYQWSSVAAGIPTT